MTTTNDPGLAATAPVTVCLLVADGTPTVLPAVAALRRESITVEVVEPDEIRQRSCPAQQVVLLWTPAEPGPDLLAGVVAWAHRAGAPALGCSPDGTPTDAERALVAGFDDWVAGRCWPREIVARVRALARRLRQSRAAVPARVQFGRVVLDFSRHEAEIEGRRHLLTPTEFALMRVLVEARGAVVERERLLDQAWGVDALEVGVRAVDNVVARLRHKLEADEFLLTVRGVGYRLAAS
jgi:DNA-binding response OmpR family regulator